MRIRNKRIVGILALCCLFLFSGCGREENQPGPVDIVALPLDGTETHDLQTAGETPAETASSEYESMNATGENVDYSGCFKGIQGCAVLYDSQENKYLLYNSELCEQEVSPYSTFKIVSTLAGLKNGVVESETSNMEYSGTLYPMSDWNDNLTLEQAFQTSCIWYFRQVIDEVGMEELQRELNELQYGNCDISQWDGSNINPLPELNGFWLASSLKISPLGQVEVLKNIFEGKSSYSEEDINILKSIMAVPRDTDGIYGKTGSGPDGQAWFVGFLEENDSRFYFAIYLDDKGQKDQVSGSTAREIALNVLEQAAEVPSF